MPDSRRHVTARDLTRLRLPGDCQISPDGKTVAFVVTEMDLERNGYTSAIWAVPADGGAEPRRLTSGKGENGPARDSSPRWSPDGTKLAFVSDRAGTAQIHVLDMVTGGEARRITNWKAGAGNPVWSPDGKWIIFSAKVKDGDAAAPASAAETGPVGGAKKDWSQPGWDPTDNPDVRIIRDIPYKFNGQGLLDGHRKLYLLEVETGVVTQVTFGPYDDSGAAWSPDGRWLAFASGRRPDRATRPRNDVWVVDLSAAPLDEARLPATRVSSIASAHSPIWSSDGRWLCYLGHNHESGTGWTTRLWAAPFAGSGGTVSGAGHSNDVVGVDGGVNGRAPVNLGSIAGDTTHHHRDFAASPDASGPAAIVTDTARPSITPRSAGLPPVAADLLPGLDRSVGGSVGSDSSADGGSDLPKFTADGQFLYMTAHVGGHVHLYRLRFPAEAAFAPGYTPDFVQVTGCCPPVVKSFSISRRQPADEVTVAFIATSVVSPGDVYTWRTQGRIGCLRHQKVGTVEELQPCPDWHGEPPVTPVVRTATGGDGAVYSIPFRAGARTRLTNLNAAWLEEVQLSTAERVTFPSVEGGTIEGWLMKPSGFKEDKDGTHVAGGEGTTLAAGGRGYPVILEIHGGPHSAYGNAFMFEFQLLCARGYGVFYTNPRGSVGYGDAFANRVCGDWAGIDYQDLMAATDYLETVPWVDRRRIGVTGGSQGGYLTNWLVGHTDRFAAAVTQRSMSNLYTKYGVSDIGWYGDKAGMGEADLWDREDFIMERSPIRYAKNVRTPILIIHSDQDYRCPLEQGEQWYVALKRLDRTTVEFVRFTGENHELSRGGKPRNRVERLERIAGWFERFIPR